MLQAPERLIAHSTDTPASVFGHERPAADDESTRRFVVAGNWRVLRGVRSLLLLRKRRRVATSVESTGQREREREGGCPWPENYGQLGKVNGCIFLLGVDNTRQRPVDVRRYADDRAAAGSVARVRVAAEVTSRRFSDVVNHFRITFLANIGRRRRKSAEVKANLQPNGALMTAYHNTMFGRLTEVVYTSQLSRG